MQEQNQPLIYALAAQNLRHRKIKLLGELNPEAIENAIAASGAGLDHTIGEQVLAIGDDSYRDPLDHFFMLTDRKLAGRILHTNRRRFFELDLADLCRMDFDFSDSAVSFKKLDDDRALQQFASQLGKSMAEVAQLIAGLSTVLSLPDAVVRESMKNVLLNFLNLLKGAGADRLVPPRYDLVCATPDDPTGAGYALQFARNPQAIMAIRLAFEAFTRGQFPEVAAKDLVGRATLLERTAAFGRGQHAGWWISPLSPNDLVHAFSGFFGRPVGAQQQGEVWALDFKVDDKSAGKALAASAAGLAAGALLGVGWISLPGVRIKDLRLSFLDAAPFTRFVVQALYKAEYAPLYAVSHKLMASLALSLREPESRLTLLRSAFGWQEPPDQLAASPPSRLELRLKELALQPPG